MLDEDVVLKAPRYENERLLMFYIPAILLLPTVFGGGGILAFVSTISISILVLVNLATYSRNWIDADEHYGKKFFACMTPYLLLFALVIFRSASPMLAYVGSDVNGGYLLQESMMKDSLASASTDLGSAIIEAMTSISIIAAAASIFFITQSRFIVRNMLAYCAIGIGALACIGFVSEIFCYLDVFSMKNIYGPDSFSTFLDANTWSFMAMMWVSAAMGISIYTFQRFKFSKFIFSVRGAALLTAMVIAASAIYTADLLHKIFIYAQLAIFFAVFAYNVVPTESMLRYHKNPELQKIKKRSKINLFFPFTLYMLLSAFSVFQFYTSFVNYKENAATPEAIEAAAYLETIKSDTKELIAQRPIFGWGPNSFTNAIALKQGDDIEMTPIANPSSDVLKFLTENGYFGMGVAILVPLFFFIRFLFSFKISQSGVIFLTTIISILILSFVSTPFHSSAVAYSFWVLLFSFFTWEDAEII